MSGGKKKPKAVKATKKGHSAALVFDPKERVEFVRGFGKRKQERKEYAKKKAEEREREVRKLLRAKRKEAIKKTRELNKIGQEEQVDDDDDGDSNLDKKEEENEI